MGLTRWQRLLRIELPLAWPVIITGIRVTTLVLLGIAAIGYIVNGPGYGELIFTGLHRVGTPRSEERRVGKEGGKSDGKGNGKHKRIKYNGRKRQSIESTKRLRNITERNERSIS